MAVEYFCAYHSYLDSMELLNDGERGRLFTACLEYSKTGVAPRLTGNERFVFSTIRGQIDRDNEKYKSKCKKLSENASSRYKHDESANGCKSTEEMQLDAKAAKEKEKEKEKENSVYGACAPTHAAEQQNEVCKKPSRFSPPTVQDVADYCRERGNQVDAQRFVDYYTANGWRVGKNPMKDWKAAVRTWEKQESAFPAPRWGKPDIPKGASGELGKAELEAIQRVLAQE